MTDSGPPAPRGEFLIYGTEDGRTLLQIRFGGIAVSGREEDFNDAIREVKQIEQKRKKPRKKPRSE